MSGVHGEEEFVPHCDEGPNHPAPLPSAEPRAAGAGPSSTAGTSEQILSVQTQGSLVSGLF